MFVCTWSFQQRGCGGKHLPNVYLRQIWLGEFTALSVQSGSNR
ncbi:MAG: hypothetical protein OJF50_005727 [Nitrospira sp.]|nr:hypothetical protein [Nitrospira sp.]